MEPDITRSFYLISLNPKRGYYFIMGNEFQYGLPGAILCDLYYNQRIAFENRKLVCINPMPTNYPFFDRAMQTIEKKQPVSVASLLTTMVFRSGFYKKRIIEILLNNKDIVRVRKKFIGIPYNRYFHLKNDERMAQIRRLRDILLRNEKPNSKELLLLVLLHVCRLYHALSDQRVERKRMRETMKQIIKNGNSYTRDFENIIELSKGVRKAIVAANARHASAAS
ncbi:MAG: GPP34 family phosphoprotein [Prolixibacteraceae bacterium]|nr:GPP34 family phosphoprotein [Prolixibacteraceae bacterium]